MSVPSDLGKLTVPQLKALCKERRIIGYSKLAKAALLQRLAEATAPSSDQASRSATAALADEVRNTACIETLTTYQDANATRQPVRQVAPLTRTTDNAESTKTSIAKAPLSAVLPKSSQSCTVASTSGPKRPAHIDISATPKRIRTFLKPATNAGHEPPVPPTSTSTLQETLLVTPSVLKVPEPPAQSQRSFHGGVSTFAKQSCTTSGHPAVPRQSTGGPGRFKPLVVSRPKPSQARIISIIPKAIDCAPVFNVHATLLPVLSHISFPPKASERKWVYRWAIILSSISTADRQTCMFVSRTFRYAIYLSAIHILSRNYPGRRLDTVLGQHARNMTNFWPYLRFRTVEVYERRHAFKQSFLGQYTDSIRYNPLSEHLWTSPDDEKQVDIALRFVLTRMWFAISVGAYGHDASTWSKCVVRDVQEVVKGEVWQVIARDYGTGKSCSFYVLEATCEVIGQPPSSDLQGEDTLGYCLRADWTAWISRRSQASLDAGPCSLLERVKWPNTEDYHRGISKAWLHHVCGQDADSITKRSVAEKYILASVVANSISGPWMTTSAMAQEFAGFPDNNVLDSRPAGRPVNTVNMYLPAHHHIESVHFTTSKGAALHAAVAVVQTPGREYYVLRENGMQVGCEEEGIPEVWQQILGCDMLGQVLSPS